MQDRDRFRALAEVSEAVGLLQDLDSLLERTLEIVISHLGAERVIVFLWSPETQELEARALRGVEDAHLLDATTVSRSALTQALEGGGILHVKDAGTGAEADPSRSMTRYGIRSLVAAPILLRGDPLGVVYCDSRARPMPLEAEDLSFVGAICMQIGVAVENARLYGRVRGEAEAMERVYGPIAREIRDRYSTRNLIGRSAAFHAVMDLVDRLKTGHTTVLVRGENGTGKELIARAIHYQSDRSEMPFVALNCAALPEELLESELFGIERGVATGVDSRSGRFEDADGGTLLLDEVGDMTPAVQAKVLRVLQERSVERVGGKKTIQVDVRVIAATSRNLEKMMQTGDFREDLFYRLAVFPIHLPPLRERCDDVPELARHFLAKAAAEHGRGTLLLSDAAIDALVRHEWPGNVRELQNVVERAVLLARGEVICVEAFAGALDTGRAVAPTGTTFPPAAGDAPMYDLPYEDAKAAWVDRFDRSYLEHALKRHGGNVSQAAAAVGLRRQRAYEILKRVGLEPSDYRDADA